MSVPRKLSFGESRTEDVSSNNNRRSPNKKTSPPRHRLQHHHSAPAISTLHSNENNANTNTSSSINSKLPNNYNNTNAANNASTANSNKKLKKQREALHSSASGSSFPPQGNHHHNAVFEAGAELYHPSAVSANQGPSAPDFEVSSDPAAISPLKTRPPSPNSVNSPTRWAGGAFHNSPPPSKLPVPAFSPKRKESNPAQSASPPPYSPDQYSAVGALPAEVQTAVSYWPGYPPHVPGPYGYAAGYGALPVYVPVTSAPVPEVQPLPVYMMPAVPAAGNVPLAQITHDLRQMLNIRA